MLRRVLMPYKFCLTSGSYRDSSQISLSFSNCFNYIRRRYPAFLLQFLPHHSLTCLCYCQCCYWSCGTWAATRAAKVWTFEVQSYWNQCKAELEYQRTYSTSFKLTFLSQADAFTLSLRFVFGAVSSLLTNLKLLAMSFHLSRYFLPGLSGVQGHCPTSATMIPPSR